MFCESSNFWETVFTSQTKMKDKPIILAVGIAGICFCVVSSALLFKAASTIGDIRPNAHLYGIAIANLLLAFALLAILTAVNCTPFEGMLSDCVTGNFVSYHKISIFFVFFEAFILTEEKETRTRIPFEESKGIVRTTLPMEDPEPAKSGKSLVFDKPALAEKPDNEPNPMEKPIDKPAPKEKRFGKPATVMKPTDEPASMVKPTPMVKPAPMEKHIDEPAPIEKAS